MQQRSINPEKQWLSVISTGAAFFLIVWCLLDALVATFIFFVVDWKAAAPAAWSMRAKLILLGCTLVTALAVTIKGTPFVLSERRKPPVARYNALLRAAIVEVFLGVCILLHGAALLIFPPSPPLRMTPSIWSAAGIGMACIFAALYGIFEIGRPRGEQNEFRTAFPTTGASADIAVRNRILTSTNRRRIVFMIPWEIILIESGAYLLGAVFMGAVAALILWSAGASATGTSPLGSAYSLRHINAAVWLLGLIALTSLVIGAGLLLRLRSYSLEIDLDTRSYRLATSSRRRWRNYSLSAFMPRPLQILTGSIAEDCQGVTVQQVTDRGSPAYVAVCAWSEAAYPSAPLSEVYRSKSDALLVMQALAAQLGLPDLESRSASVDPAKSPPES